MNGVYSIPDRALAETSDRGQADGPRATAIRWPRPPLGGNGQAGNLRGSTAGPAKIECRTRCTKEERRADATEGARWCAPGGPAIAYMY